MWNDMLIQLGIPSTFTNLWFFVWLLELCFVSDLQAVSHREYNIPGHSCVPRSLMYDSTIIHSTNGKLIFTYISIMQDIHVFPNLHILGHNNCTHQYQISPFHTLDKQLNSLYSETMRHSHYVAWWISKILNICLVCLLHPLVYVMILI